MWYCKDCGEYFDTPYTIGEIEVRVCPYCGSTEVKAIDQEKDWRKEINE